MHGWTIVVILVVIIYLSPPRPTRHSRQLGGISVGVGRVLTYDFLILSGRHCTLSNKTFGGEYSRSPLLPSCLGGQRSERASE